MKPNPQQQINYFREWTNSCVDDQLIHLNVIPLEEQRPYEFLFYSDAIPRRNDGRVTSEILKTWMGQSISKIGQKMPIAYRWTPVDLKVLSPLVEAGIEQQACLGLYRFHEADINILKKEDGGVLELIYFLEKKTFGVVSNLVNHVIVTTKKS